MNNRQLRSWVFMLYPDNSRHMSAINYLDLQSNSLLIKHIEKKTEDGKILNKEHYHCVMKFDQGYWLSSLLNDLGLSEEDSHLFHSYTDFKVGKKNKFKSLENYVDYLDHQLNDKKEDKYDPDDFSGGLKKWALSIINNREKENYIKFKDVCDFIREYNLEHFLDTRTWTFQDWYNLCCDNGYGSMFYKEWYKMRDIIKPYLNY